MSLEWLLTGLSLGFLGSAHCLSMCGPLAMGLPRHGAKRLRMVAERLTYNAGRILTYTMLGGAFGALGLVIAFAGYQQWLSVVLGLLMIIAAIMMLLRRRLGGLEAIPVRFVQRLFKALPRLYQRGGFGSMLAVGLLNGLLPCGLVYAGLATAATGDSIGASMGFMAAFGLGTLPAMLAISLLGGMISVEWRTRLQKLIPLGLLILGILLVLRGLSLGVLLSPDLREALFTPGVCRFLPLVEPATP